MRECICALGACTWIRIWVGATASAFVGKDVRACTKACANACAWVRLSIIRWNILAALLRSFDI